MLFVRKGFLASIGLMLLWPTVVGDAAYASSTSFSCGSGSYVVADGIASGGEDCTGALVLDSSVITIGQAAFFGNENISSVVIPTSVITIGNAAFSYAYQIATVTFQEPSQVSTIEESAFRGLTSLTTLNLPNSIRTIGNFAFLDSNWPNNPRTDQMLSMVNLGQGITTIGAEVFIGIQPTVLTIPSSVTTIGDHAFWKLMNLTTLNFDSNSNLASLEDNSFDEMPMLTHVYYCGTPPLVLANYSFPNSINITHGNCPIVSVTKIKSPQITGTAKKGRTLTSSKGAWSGTSPTISFKWYRCSKKTTRIVSIKPSACVAIAGANKRTYKIATKDVKKYLLVSVTARNSVSSITSWTISTTKVK